MFAIKEGDHKGKFAVCIEPTKSVFKFLFLPEMEPYDVPFKDVSRGFDSRMLDFVEKLPDDIFSLCRAQYEKNCK